jgi:hypothetical protein
MLAHSYLLKNSIVFLKGFRVFTGGPYSIVYYFNLCINK